MKSVSIKQFEKIILAIQDNSTISMSAAKGMTKNILRIFHEGESLFIPELNLELKTLEEYKEWKKDEEFLNFFNSENLLKEIQAEIK